jgi:hypothetical protein
VQKRNVFLSLFYHFKFKFFMYQLFTKAAGATICSAMGRETISKNRVSSRKTTGVGRKFFRKEGLL